tara:strand:- start:37 stop:330 length:294 start_codon:yes stop_codon:yes gene_type:complete
MAKDRFGYGIPMKNEKVWNFINSPDGVRFVEGVIKEYGPEEMGKMVLGHFLETGEYIPKTKMDNKTFQKIKKGKYTIDYAHSDWISEMFFNAKEGRG